MNTETRDTAYHQFHAARRKKLLDYIEKRVKEWVQMGGGDNGYIRSSAAYDGMENLPGHKDKDIWNAAWKACMKARKQ
jgi:hypothetical protein